MQNITKALGAARARREENEKGFTLIELLVVVLIIGILSAIAIPIFLGQQQQARDAAVESDITNLKVAIVSALVSDPNGALNTDPTGYAEFTPGADSAITIVGSNAAFCISGSSTANGVGAKTYAASDTSGTIPGTCVGNVATPTP